MEATLEVVRICSQISKAIVARDSQSVLAQLTPLRDKCVQLPRDSLNRTIRDAVVPTLRDVLNFPLIPSVCQFITSAGKGNVRLLLPLMEGIFHLLMDLVATVEKTSALDILYSLNSMLYLCPPALVDCLTLARAKIKYLVDKTPTFGDVEYQSGVFELLANFKSGELLGDRHRHLFDNLNEANYYENLRIWLNDINSCGELVRTARAHRLGDKRNVYVDWSVGTSRLTSLENEFCLPVSDVRHLHVNGWNVEIWTDSPSPISIDFEEGSAAGALLLSLRECAESSSRLCLVDACEFAPPVTPSTPQVGSPQVVVSSPGKAVTPKNNKSAAPLKTFLSSIVQRQLNKRQKLKGKVQISPLKTQPEPVYGRDAFFSPPKIPKNVLESPSVELIAKSLNSRLDQCSGFILKSLRRQSRSAESTVRNVFGQVERLEQRLEDMAAKMSGEMEKIEGVGVVSVESSRDHAEAD